MARFSKRAGLFFETFALGTEQKGGRVFDRAESANVSEKLRDGFSDCFYRRGLQYSVYIVICAVEGEMDTGAPAPAINKGLIR